MFKTSATRCVLSNLRASYYGTRKKQNVRSFLDRGHPQVELSRWEHVYAPLRKIQEVPISCRTLVISTGMWGITEKRGMHPFTYSFKKPALNQAVRARRDVDAIPHYVELDKSQSRGILSA